MDDKFPVLKVKRLRPGARLPEAATAGAAGLDLYACLEALDPLAPIQMSFDFANDLCIVIEHDPVLVPTGIAIEVPLGYEAQVRPRSGLAARGVAAVFGTIDSDYRGEIFVTMYLLGALTPYTVHHGDRIAQLVLARLADLPLLETDELTSSERGAAGHGSTGR